MRPRFHFTPARGWMNDPHGITYHDGRYHLFFQSIPDSVEWRPDCRWGHATSPDLFTFDVLPDVLEPGDGDDGVWSGSLVVDDAGDAIIFYTSVRVPDVGAGRVRTARPLDDGWLRWAKGPVVAEAPDPRRTTSFRDPFVTRDQRSGDWRMYVGTSFDGEVAAATAFASNDLATWRNEGIVVSRSSAERDPVWTGSLWECPQIFELEDRAVLVTSVWDADRLYHVAYAIGDMSDGAFVPESWERLTYGDAYYAPSFFRDRVGRPCLMFWLRGVADEDAGWAGALSVPHVLELDGDRLIAVPHPDLARRRSPTTRTGRTDALTGDAEWEGGTCLRLSSGGAVASLRRGDGELEIEIGGQRWTMPSEGGAVRLVIDGPVLEVSSTAGLLAAPIQPRDDSVRVESDGVLRLFSVL